MFVSIISPSLSPNVEQDDFWEAIKTMCLPWKWKTGVELKRVETWFEKQYPNYDVTLFNSGRSALFAVLRAFNIQSQDEVLVQSFTCVAVPNSVLWTLGKPVFVDIDHALNMDPIDMEKKITPKTKAVIIQHTFGIPAQVDAILSVAKKHKLIVIEDCAHSLGARYKNNLVGSFGDASFFSFGRDKVVSSVWGGAAMIKKNHPGVMKKMKSTIDLLPTPTYAWIFQQLLHPIAFGFILPLYRVYIGKLLLVVLQTFRMLSFPVFPEEKKGQRPQEFPKRYVNGLASLLVRQLGKLPKFINIRQSIDAYYRKNIPASGVTFFPPIEGQVLLRFPLLVDNPDVFIAKAKKKGILIGNWYSHAIDPKGVDFLSIGYNPRSCPNAEKIAKHIINLPTRISLTQAQQVVDLFS